MKSKEYRPELVVPAGDWPSLLSAVESGADSVYFGLKGWNMRQYADNFEPKDLRKVMTHLHERGRHGYLALNTIVKESEVPKLARILNRAKQAGVDAVIVWDMAWLALARQAGLRVHLSTQASVANSRAVAFFAKQGVRRIILARECSLAEIGRINRRIQRLKIPCEIEVFIHGAMCLSISGRCFLSHYVSGQSANRGACEQPCRREYLIREKDGPAEFLVGQDYILSPRDLCALDFIGQLMRTQPAAFKIEGRMRSPEYVATVTRVYRQAIDRQLAGRLTAPDKHRLKKELDGVYHRGFSSGFYFPPPQKTGSRGPQHVLRKFYVGEIVHFFRKIQVAEIRVLDNELKQGDALLVLGRHLPLRRMQVGEMQRNHRPVSRAAKGQRVGLKVPFAVRPREKVYVIRPRPGREDAL